MNWKITIRYVYLAESGESAGTENYQFVAYDASEALMFANTDLFTDFTGGRFVRLEVSVLPASESIGHNKTL